MTRTEFALMIISFCMILIVFDLGHIIVILRMLRKELGDTNVKV